MTREEFIEILHTKEYPYEIIGDKLVITEGGHVGLNSLETLPSGVEFNNGGGVYLKKLTGGWFSEWKGNIEGIGNKTILNTMIKRELFSE